MDWKLTGRNLLTLHDISDAGIQMKASLLRQIIWSVLSIVSISCAIAAIRHSELIPRYASVLGIVWPVSLGLMFYSRKKNPRAAAILFISFLMLMIFVFSWSGGGIKGHGIKILPIVVLFAGLTLGKREIWIFAFVAIAGDCVLLLAEEYGYLPRVEPLGQSPIVYLIFTTTGIILVSFLENLSVEVLRNSLVKLEEEIALRKKSEEMLKIKNEMLLEVAYLQSHMVRHPLTKVLGVIKQLNTEKLDDPANAELLPILESASKELDAVIHEIVKNTHDIEKMMDEEEKKNLVSGPADCTNEVLPG